ncbi:2OG-Fe dioxygenase family protein [Actinokineospora sp. UTMC 2448]|uniref:2OG-Fe dioxygenase family protein n=1 Tax=Actinokineospora sp. UTMC 2448 TaxID=2268449 RepID=UPI002164EDE8|nr:2OG-Fe dioxygenase family protein [Actinokineospora sp. UTMC 2448]UVS81020.1 hypothetical protein Actkin_04772 [Actinokineospora sp. UTMC 2448]
MHDELQLVDIKGQLRDQGHSLVRGPELPLDPAVREHEEALAAEWDNLGPDNYLKGGGRFRERRYGRYCYIPAERSIRLLAHQPYYQSPMANTYAGGIHRVVDPLTQSSVDNPLMNALIEFNYAQFPVAPEWDADAWEVACHQFRIIATPDEVGEPTPEGIHRDEIDFGAIHLMSRTNVAGGVSLVYDNDRRPIAEFALESRMDTMFWADHDVLHAVTPITPADPRRPAVRDILILGYRRVPELRDAS